MIDKEKFNLLAANYKDIIGNQMNS